MTGKWNNSFPVTCEPLHTEKEKGDDMQFFFLDHGGALLQDVGVMGNVLLDGSESTARDGDHYKLCHRLSEGDSRMPSPPAAWRPRAATVKGGWEGHL